MQVFVTGASGFVGRHTVTALCDAGHSVIGLVRRPQEPREGVTYVTGSITDTPPEQLAEYLTGCDAVIHLVGIITEIRAEGQTFERVHVEGTENLLTAVRLSQDDTNPLKRFLYLSALWVSPTAPSEYSRTKAIAEEQVKNSGLPYTILRPSVILGSDGEFLQQVEGLIRKPPLSPFPLPFVPIPGDGQTRFQPVHIDDITHCLVSAPSTPATTDQTYDIGGADEVTFDELVYSVAQYLETSKPLLHVPMPAMFAAGAVLESVLPHPPITTDQLINLQRDSVCDNTSIRQAFDFSPLSFSETLRRCYPDKVVSETP